MRFTGRALVQEDLAEKDIENQILGWLLMKEREGEMRIMGWKVKSQGTFDPKTKRFRAPSKYFRKGCPDVLVCLDGQLIGLEVKTRLGRCSEAQSAFHESLERAGGRVFVVRSLSQVQALFELAHETKVAKNSINQPKETK